MTDILDLPGWVLTGKRNDGAVETFEAEYVHEARACEKCGSVSFYRHGTKKTTYTDSPLRGFTAKLEATVRRYRCKDCNETFLQPLGGVLDERRMTERCAKFIAQAALRHTFVHVAREVGVDEGTVRSVAAERIAQLHVIHDQAPGRDALRLAFSRDAADGALDRPALQVRRALALLRRREHAALLDHLEQRAARAAHVHRLAGGGRLDVLEGAGPFDRAQVGVHDHQLRGRHVLAQQQIHRLAILPPAVIHNEQSAPLNQALNQFRDSPRFVAEARRHRNEVALHAAARGADGKGIQCVTRSTVIGIASTYRHTLPSR